MGRSKVRGRYRVRFRVSNRGWVCSRFSFRDKGVGIGLGISIGLVVGVGVGLVVKVGVSVG